MRDAATCGPTNGPDVALTLAGTCSPRSFLQHCDAFDGSLAIPLMERPSRHFPHLVHQNVAMTVRQLQQLQVSMIGIPNMSRSSEIFMVKFPASGLGAGHCSLGDSASAIRRDGARATRERS